MLTRSMSKSLTRKLNISTSYQKLNESRVYTIIFLLLTNSFVFIFRISKSEFILEIACL